VKPLVVAKGRLPSDGGLRRHLQAAIVALEREAHMIDVRCTSKDDPLRFEVAVGNRAGQTRHQVTMTKETHERLGAGGHTPERCLEAAFRFLLDREPKESILASFDITVISRYFPEFEKELPGYLSKA
jgi:hypothetical protein